MRVQGFFRRKFLELEPVDIFELVGLPVFNLFRIDKNFKIKRNPVSLQSLVPSVDIPVAQKFKVQNFRTVFFAYFTFKRVFDRIVEFNAATTRIPPAVIAAVSFLWPRKLPAIMQ